MRATPTAPPLLRVIFVSPSSTALMHDVSAEWNTMHSRESLPSRRPLEWEDVKVRALAARVPAAGGKA